MFRATKIFLQSFPLQVISWKIKCKVFQIKITQLNKWQYYFKNKNGIEIGGPSGIFNVSGYLPLYNIAHSIDGVNFSNNTVWEGTLQEGNTYKYYNKTGYQYIAEGDNLSNIANETNDFVLSCNNLEHMANPLKAIFEWKRILKKDGVMLLVLPNKEANFDHKRPYTSIEHLINDYNSKTTEEDTTHLNEILKLHDLRRDPQAGSFDNFVTRCNNNIKNRCMHHHVFSQKLLKEMMQFCNLKVLRQNTTYTDHYLLATKNIEQSNL
jgi:SAM-dependent methyltransferase